MQHIQWVANEFMLVSVITEFLSSLSFELNLIKVRLSRNLMLSELKAYCHMHSSGKCTWYCCNCMSLNTILSAILLE